MSAYSGRARLESNRVRRDLVNLSRRGPGLSYLLLGGGSGWNCESAARYIASGVRRTAQGEAIDRAARVGKASLLAAAGVLGAGLIGMGITYLKHRRKLPSPAD